MRVEQPAWIIICLALVAGLGLGLGFLAQPAVAQGSCTELITNGGFEGAGGWTLGLDPAQPQYVDNQVHGGQRALLLGIPPGYPNQRSYSSVRQLVVIPANATQVTLTFWYLAIMPGAPSTDYVEMALLAPDGHNLLDKPWRSFVDNRLWNGAAFDLSGWRGQTIQVYFNVFNDGGSSPAAMYLDDVSLQPCGAAAATGTVTRTPTSTVGPSATYTRTPRASRTATTTATATATRTPTRTPTGTITPYPLPAATATFTPRAYPPPAAPAVPSDPAPDSAAPSPYCVDLVKNGNFDLGWTYWQRAPNKIPAILLMPPAYPYTAVRLGTQEVSGVESYSSLRQLVHIPSGNAQVLLQFWAWTWSEATAGTDHQEADFLEPDPAVLQKFWRELRNDQAWAFYSFDVTEYAGRSVVLYFNVYNDGVSGRTAMYLDSVHMWACPGPFYSPLVQEQAAPQVQQAVPVAQPRQPTVTAAPGVTAEMTVLTLITPPTPATGTPEPTVTGGGVGVLPGTGTATPTPVPGILNRIAQALRLPPPPPYLGLGLLAIVVVLLLLWVFLRAVGP